MAHEYSKEKHSSPDNHMYIAVSTEVEEEVILLTKINSIAKLTEKENTNLIIQSYNSWNA